ncbi:Mur ligase [Tilletiopsis washingtonensis]|uniref:Mur ligase n=1 Tax=Tilletiopsis washingtonensis TaxID=58919 RepID=A0A316Z9Z5_9BASI|nr:Mur ligase [Tilletiopsis washingtonensis]PWN98116.1 Mur ligase [Tilletiopsis washingtonensis]
MSQLHTASSAGEAVASSSSSTSRAVIDLGLQRITSLLALLGRPELGFAVIHVAGTNAKGSTTAYLDSLLRATTGTRTGRFNSPHLVEERDACRVDGVPVRTDVWEEARRKVQAADAEAGLQCTPFELLTARAFTAFRLMPLEQRPEVLLVEVGLGGLLDATNIFEPRHVLASVICPVDFDHQALLGDTLAAIAEQKAGIVRRGGLCVIADQRRGDAATQAEVDCTALRGIEVERSQVGMAAEIHEAIRRSAVAATARLCKAYVPWQVLDEAPLASSSASTPWSTSVQVNVRHTPLLYPSSSTSPSFAGTYAARAGDGLVSGPLLVLPRTRAALSGALTALQTLWAIARDETPGGLGQDGSDEHEELRLRIAWALRDDRDATLAIAHAVASTTWEGRAAWLDVPLPAPASQSSSSSSSTTPQAAQARQVEDEEMRPADSDTAATLASASEQAQAPPQCLHLLTDGAHNASACVALQRYLCGCLSARLASACDAGAAATSSDTCGVSEVTITYLLSFSAGKDVAAMLSALLAPPASTSLEAQMARTTLAPSQAPVRLRRRVGLLSFSTPVEGMPWVTPLAPSTAAHALRQLQLEAEVEVRVFETHDALAEALRWAAQLGDGRSMTAAEGERQASMCVVAGSLYLVGDLYRLLARSSE